MEREPTDDKLSRKLWLIGHSFPAIWIRNIPQNGTMKRNRLSARPAPSDTAQHSYIVLDYLQDRVYKKGWLRLDICKCYVFIGLKTMRRMGNHAGV